MAIPVFSLAQIVQQLRTSWGGSSEGTTESWSGTGAINYYIGGTPYASGSGEAAYKVTMTSLMQSRATLAFELWDDLIARNLNQVSTAAFGQIQFEYSSRTYDSNGNLSTGGGTYSGPWISGGGTGPYGTANYNITRDEIWLNSNWTSHNADNDMYFGGYGFQTYMHEIGHSLGLSHPGTYDAGSGGSITYANNAEYSLDNRQYTIMSYFGGYAPGVGWQQDGTYSNWLYSSTPMLDDVAAIQTIYGADMTTRAGDTTYGFHSNAGRDVFDFTIDTSPIVTVWDAGGNDTLDVSGYSANQRIDLHAGTYSDIGGMVNNVAIAFNVTIESAIGGSGNDTITGNDADNVLRGNAGNDTINGGAGTDTAVFSGLRSSYSLTDLGGNSVRVTGPDGTDVLSNIEYLRFDDQTVPWPSIPDLIVANLVLTGTAASFSVTDIGGSAAASSIAGLYLSTDSTITTSDTRLVTAVTPGLAAGVSDRGAVLLTLPGNLTPGTYYLGVIADYSGQVAEGDELNNVSNVVAVILGNSSGNVVAGTSAGDALFGLGGNDTLNGGVGADMLTGGAGADMFVFDTAALTDAQSSTPIFDRITDYDQGNSGIVAAAEGDQVDLSAILSTAFNGGAGQPVNAMVRAIQDGMDGSSVLQVDPDGAANGTHWITLARLDGISAGHDINVVLTGSQPVGQAITVQDANATTLVSNFNGDASGGDLLWRHQDGSVDIWLMNGAGIQSSTSLGQVPLEWRVVGTGDFNGDGKSDLLWRAQDGTAGLWIMNGAGPQSSANISQIPLDWRVVGMGDFNGDGKSDILWRNDSGMTGLWTMSGAGPLSSANIGQVDNTWHIAGTGDFNGDGKSDLLWRHQDGAIGVWLMSGGGPQSAANIGQVDNTWHIAGTGDFNGDGKSDILWRSDSGAVGIWAMNGAGPQSSSNVGQLPLDWHIVGTGDFNGDGISDILWNSDGGTVSVWLMNATGPQSAFNIGQVSHEMALVAHHYDLV